MGEYRVMLYEGSVSTLGVQELLNDQLRQGWRFVDTLAAPATDNEPTPRVIFIFEQAAA
jgi:hypothetical protein